MQAQKIKNGNKIKFVYDWQKIGRKGKGERKSKVYQTGREETGMGAEKKKYVSMDKRSKREQKEYYSSMRCGWNGLNPATRTMPNGKAYRRKKAKQEEQRLSREFRGGSSAESFSLLDV